MRTRIAKRGSAFALALVSIALSFQAQCAEDSPKDPEAEIAQLCTPKPPFFLASRACETSRLSSYEPIYAVYQRTQDDERAARLHYSFRYLLGTPDCLTEYGEAVRNEEEFKKGNPG